MEFFCDNVHKKERKIIDDVRERRREMNNYV